MINIHGWKLDNYRRNPVVLWMEPSPFTQDDPDELVGTSRIWLENGKLLAEWFPDRTSEIALKIAKKLSNGSTFGASVTFLPITGHYGQGYEAKGGSRQTYYHERQELLSWKICTIPSNPYCVYQKLAKQKIKDFQRKRMRSMMRDLNTMR